MATFRRVFTFLQVFVIAFFHGLVKAEDSDQMVAFLCNRPSMYKTSEGWKKDDSIDCLKDPEDILDYCRKVYPESDVRNIVEANEKIEIDNWCDFGQTLCHHKFTVRPFRCLVGPFQSDALLVPEHCIFDHVHDSKLCTSYGEWNKSAISSCDGRSMRLHSFSMLQPCGIDRFNGVEFVCCPASSQPFDVDTSDEVASVDEVFEPTTTTTAAPTTTDGPLSSYMERTGGRRAGNNGHKWNEHDYFVKAMEDMGRHHEDKINKMMKDWSAARQRVQELKSRDPLAAEKLNKEITARFQKTYDALEVENTSERKQLSSLHQQRVQAELNEKKRIALDDYAEAIDDGSDASDILRTLKQYIKVVQKDRLHTINRYKHLRDTDPAEAEALRQEMADHLRGIDQQMTVALGMLDRVPKYKRKVELQINDYMDAYHTVDASVNVLLRSLIDNPPSTTVQPPFRQDFVDEIEPEEATGDEEEDDEDYEDSDEDSDREDRDEDIKEQEDYLNKNTEVAELNKEEEAEMDTKDGIVKLPVGKKVGGLEDVQSVTVKPVVLEYKEEETVTVKPVVVEYKEEDAVVADKSLSITDEDEADEEDGEETDEDEKEEADEDYEGDESKDDGEDDGEVDGPADEMESEKKEYSMRTSELDFMKPAEPDRIDKSYISINEPFISKASDKGVNSFSAAVPIGITVAVMTVLVIIAAGVLVVRRRARRRSLRTAVNVRLDPSASPEERHIAAMQMTGYENPTYKYFEQSGSASA